MPGIEWPPIGELAAHSAYDMFSKYLNANIIISPPRFLEWEFLSDCAISKLMPTFTFLE